MIDIANIIWNTYIIALVILFARTFQYLGVNFVAAMVLAILPTIAMFFAAVKVCRLFPRWGRYLILPEALVWEPKWLNPPEKPKE